MDEIKKIHAVNLAILPARLASPKSSQDEARLIDLHQNLFAMRQQSGEALLRGECLSFSHSMRAADTAERDAECDAKGGENGE